MWGVRVPGLRSPHIRAIRRGGEGTGCPAAGLTHCSEPQFPPSVPRAECSDTFSAVISLRALGGGHRYDLSVQVGKLRPREGLGPVHGHLASDWQIQARSHPP